MQQVEVTVIGEPAANASEPVKFQSDTDFADAVRRRLKAALEPIMDLMDEVDRRGMHICWSCGRDKFGRNVLTDVNISRPY